MKIIKEALLWGQKQLDLSDCANSHLEASILLSHVLGVERLHLFTWPKQELTELQNNHYQNLIARKQSGEPTAYIVGIKEFFNRDFIVSPDVLIPRPDTEKLVETALDFLPVNEYAKIIDVCTGTGCIALTLALERPKLEVIAVDISLEALKIAEANKKAHKITDRVQFLPGDLLSSCANLANIDLIVANPPYIKADAICSLAKEVREFEPHLALIGPGDDGLLFHKRIIEMGILLLKVEGRLLLEIGFDQKDDIAAWAKSKKLNFNFIKDDANHHRIICIKNRGKL